eukprot:11722919-Prorocentrum_lima.AAC.1
MRSTGDCKDWLVGQLKGDFMDHVNFIMFSFGDPINVEEAAFLVDLQTAEATSLHELTSED